MEVHGTHMSQFSVIWMATALTVAMAPAALGGQAQDVRCSYVRKVECDTSGCQEGAVGSAYLLLPHVRTLMSQTIKAEDGAGLPTIRRCDAKGCTPLEVTAWPSGAFVNLTQPAGAYFVKLSTVDLGKDLRPGDFVEVASLMLGTVTYFGRCPEAVR